MEGWKHGYGSGRADDATGGVGGAGDEAARVGGVSEAAWQSGVAYPGAAMGGGGVAMSGSEAMSMGVPTQMSLMGMSYGFPGTGMAPTTGDTSSGSSMSRVPPDGPETIATGASRSAVSGGAPPPESLESLDTYARLSGASQNTTGSGPGPNYGQGIGHSQHQAQSHPEGSSSSTAIPAPPVSTTASTPTAPGGARGQSSGKPIRRRMRMITSCLECRRRKLKCDKSHPCTNCVRFHRECVYLGPKLDEAGQLRLTEIKEKVGSLERQLERDVKHNLSSPAKQQRILADDVEGQYQEGQGLEPTDMVALDHTYEDTADDTDEVIDLGVLVGRMRLTDRIGGFSRPRISEEISAGMAKQPTGRPGMPTGPPGMPPMPPMPPGSQPQQPQPNVDFSMGTSDPSWPDYLRPGANYIPPSNGLLMGQVGGAPSLEALLPTKGAADRLIQQYFDAVYPIVRCVHQPSFETSYQEFWDHVFENIEPRASLQALVFSAMFSGAVSMDDATAQQEFGKTQRDLCEMLKLGTETALSKANFLRTTRVETLQAFVIYLLPLCRDELSRAHSVLVGAAIRMAECMGLHRDGETYGLDPLDTHVRRLIWYQLCFLDIRTCEAHGPRPSIRRDDYETKLPLNCDDDQFRKDAPAPQPADRWTSMMWPLMRFEMNEMMRIIWIDRRRIEARKITLTEVLAKIENFRSAMIEKYNHHLNDGVPLQRYARLVMHLFLCRLHVMTLHAYHINATAQLPPRLANVLITSGIMICEIGIQLETVPEFQVWRWYAGAYHQYQIALILATEMYYKPHSPEGPRTWACLDYVFNLDRNLPPEAKGMLILKEVIEKMGAYHRMRKARATNSIQQAVPSRNAIIGKGEGGDTLPPHLQQQQHAASHGQMGGMPPGMPMPPGQPPYPNMPGAAQPQWSGESPGSNTSSEHDKNKQAPPPHLMMGMPGPEMRQYITVNWDVINTLFTSDPVSGELSIPGYHDPALGLNWHG